MYRLTTDSAFRNTSTPGFDNHIINLHLPVTTEIMAGAVLSLGPDINWGISLIMDMKLGSVRYVPEG